MLRKRLVLAAVCLALTPACASAGGLSFESRGYGGPLYIGPNFQQGGQHSTPTYDKPSYRQERYTPPREKVTRERRARPAQPVDTAKTAPVEKPEEKSIAKKAADNENSTIAATAPAKDKPVDTAESATETPEAKKGPDRENSTIAGKSSDEAKPAKTNTASTEPKNLNCTRFVAAVSKTISVPCD